LPLAADELTDRLTLLADLWRDVDPHTALVHAASTPATRRAAIGWLARQPHGRVADLPALIGLGERQLRRRFQVAVGYEPKRLARILRLQRLLALAERTPPGRGRLAALALAAGYADQAHLVRECVELAGLTPGALLPGAASALALADFFKTL